jgi:hypothetical protein
MRSVVLICFLAALAGPVWAQSRRSAGLTVDQCPADALAPEELERYLELEDDEPRPDVDVRCADGNKLNIVLQQGERVWTRQVWLGDTPRSRWPRVVALAVAELVHAALEAQPAAPPPSLALTLPLPLPSPALIPDRGVMRTRQAGVGLVTVGALAILGGVALFEIVANNGDVLSPIGESGMALGVIGGAAAAAGSGLLSRRLPDEPVDPAGHAVALRTSLGLGALSFLNVVAASVLVAEGRAVMFPTVTFKPDGTLVGEADFEASRSRQNALYSGSVALYGVAALSLVGSGVAAGLAARHPTRPYATLTSDRRGLTVGWEGSF